MVDNIRGDGFLLTYTNQAESISDYLDIVIDGFDLGQTWQDVTASRASNITYTNTTGKPIEVCITTFNNSAVNTTYTIYIDENLIAKTQNVFNGDLYIPVTFTVPNSSTYKVVASTSMIYNSWSELR